MSGADFWRVGYGAEFAQNVERIASSLEKISKQLARIADAMDPPTIDPAKPPRSGGIES